VTATTWVDDWTGHHQGKVLLRKINGRWWTDDNREVYAPGKKGVFWEVDSKPDTCLFHHHRPFDLTHVSWLHLWMSPDDVEQMLGEPNREFGPRGQGFWYYYGADGTALRVRFMSGVLGEADYDKGAKTWPVDSVKQELGGRSIYEVMAERATKKVDSSRRTRELPRVNSPSAPPNRVGRSSHSQQASIIEVPPSAAGGAPPAPPEPISTITAAALASVKIGMSREDVLRSLGKPSSRFSVAGSDGVNEYLSYQVEDGRKVAIRLLSGKVTQLP
jgi:SmpA / OmlA family